jgi:serine/threonine-protein kinase
MPDRAEKRGPESSGWAPASAPKLETLAHRSFGKYTILAALGEGATAQVYLASVHGPGGFNKLFVVKVLRPSVKDDEQFRKMFMSEARLAARLNHPNVVQTNDVSSDGDDYFMTMEYLEGQTLFSILKRVGREGSAFPLRFHLRVLSDVLAGLDYAHRLEDFDGVPLKIVHRDVSPQNLIVTYEGNVKVLDFGIAKAADNVERTEAGVMKGKIRYMSPEQIFASSDIDCRSDIYSMGVMLWEALTGHRLRSGPSEVNILNAIIKEDVISPRTVNPNVDPELEGITLKALARNRSARYATAADMQNDLDRAIERLGLRVSSRDLGSYVSNLFATERSAIRKVVETQMTSPSVSVPWIPALSPTSEGHLMVSGPTLQPVDFRPPADASVAVAHGARGIRRDPRVAVGVTGVAVVLVLAFAFHHRKAVIGSAGPSVSPAAPLLAESSATPAQPSALVAASAGPMSTHSLTVTVTPSFARISVDGTLVSGNPHTFVLPADSASHALHAEAPGYIPKDQAITLNRDSQLTWSLGKAVSSGWGRPVTRPGPALAPSVVIAATPATPQPTAQPTASDPGEPKIDMRDPYAK